MASHDPVTPHNFDVTIVERNGHLVQAKVHLRETVPPGGIDLDVTWDSANNRVISIDPWRNLGVFVTEALAAKARA